MTFDLSQFELSDTSTLTVQNAKGDDDLIGADGVNPVTIDLYGPGSKQAVKALHRAGMQAAATLKAVVNGKIPKDAPETAEREQTEKLVAFTKAIGNFPVAPADLYGNPKLGYITKQVVAFIGNESNFLPQSSTDSASTSDSSPG